MCVCFSVRVCVLVFVCVRHACVYIMCVFECVPHQDLVLYKHKQTCKGLKKIFAP